MNKVYIGLGSNLGNRRKNLTDAYLKLEERVGKILKKSGFYKTPPWGFESDEDFVNTVVFLQTELGLEHLLTELKKIEKESGRKLRAADEPYSDRLIDLDIIDFNGRVHETDRVIVPHEKMHLRNFVLVPLAEIAPEWIHPKIKKNVKKLIEKLPKEPPVEKI